MIEVGRIRADEWDALRDIRLAALADAPNAFASTHAVEAEFDDTEWKRRAGSWSSGSDSASFLARLGEEVVGLVGAHRLHGDDTVELVSMWTSPRARRHGVGRSLVEAIVDWAGQAEVRLWVIRGNDGAAALYEACGFELTEETQPLPSDPCKDEIRMRHLR